MIALRPELTYHALLAAAACVMNETSRCASQNHLRAL